MANKTEEIRALIGGMVKDSVTDAVKQAFGDFQSEQGRTTRMKDILTGDKAAGRVEVLPDRYEKEPGIKAARWVRAMAASKLRCGAFIPNEAAKVAAEWWGEGYEIVGKLSASDFAAGGALIPPNYIAEVIELLRPQSVVRSLNPLFVDLIGGTATWPKITGGATAGWVGEAPNQNASDVATGDLVLSAKKLQSLVPISNDLIRRSSPAADIVVRDDMLSAMAQTSDLAYIRGAGSAYSPKGLRNWAPAGNAIAMTATPTVLTVNADFSRLFNLLETQNVRMIRPGIIIPVRVKNWLYDLQLETTGGMYAFRSEMDSGTLRGVPFRASNQIPTNLGGGTETEVYLADFADVIVADEGTVVLESSTEASYHDAGGTLVSAFAADRTVIKTILNTDFGMRHDASVAVLTGVTWGA